MKTLKYYWLTLKIALLTPLVYIENKYTQYKEWRLKMFVNNQIIAESGYDINVIMALLKNKRKN